MPVFTRLGVRGCKQSFADLVWGVGSWEGALLWERCLEGMERGFNATSPKVLEEDGGF
jgi:hypothetical protein